MTRRSRTPFARAVRMKSRRRTSSIAERDILATTPVATTASAVAGMTRWCSRSGRSPPPYRAYMPDAGTQRRFTAKYRIIIMPRKNDGTEIPTRTEKVISLSARPYWRVAEMTPARMPRTEHMTKASPDKINVALKRSSISSMTGRFKEKDRPRSP